MKTMTDFIAAVILGGTFGAFITWVLMQDEIDLLRTELLRLKGRDE